MSRHSFSGWIAQGLACGGALFAASIPSAAVAQQAVGRAVQAIVAPAVPLVPSQGSVGTLVVEGEMPVAVDGAVPSTPPATPEEAAAQQAKTERLQKIQQLQFDRRASAILKAWSGLKADGVPNPDEMPEPPIQQPQPELTPEQKAALEKSKAFDESLVAFQRQVTLGNWAEVKAFIAGLEPDEARAAYRQLLASLQSGPPGAAMGLNPQLLNQMLMTGNAGSDMLAQLAAGGMGPGAQFLEQNVFAPADLIGLIAAAPIVPDKPEANKSEPAKPVLDKPALAQLGAVLRQTLTRGHQLSETLAALSAAKGAEDKPLLDKRQMALLLFAAGQEIETGAYLPTLEEAQAANDREGLNLVSRQLLAVYNKEEKVEQLEKAWAAIQAALAAGDVDQEAKEEALRRAVEIAPKIRAQLGQAWLDESFTARVDRGKEILGTIGAVAAMNLQARPSDSEGRLNELRLQKTAVEALLKAAPEQAKEWREVLGVLAGNWLREAGMTYQFDTSTSYGPQIRRDYYGNYFWYQEDEDPSMRFARENGIQPIRTPDMLDTRPSDAWLALVSDSQRPEFLAQAAQLFLKVQDETQAFPYIEQLAATHPDKSHALCEEFLRVWTKNHNPNDTRDRTNFYMFSWGYEQRADSIPLTRSKQERNLTELAEWIKRLRALPVKELDEKLLAQAFMVSHSEAEVYRLESIERVFGSLDGLAPATLAELIQHMRANLATVWQKPDVQKKNSTRRREKDIEVEVLRGFDVARQVLDKALAKYPDDWQLDMALASVMHDEAVYRNELAQSTEFTPKRREALERFAHAASLYAKDALTRSKNDETAEVYETWYYASLGAVDLAKVKPESVADLSQPAKIREALLALPGEAADRHLGRFANELFTRLSAASPEMKFRFLRGGFEIVGDQKQAHEARKVYDYYKDLVSEIKLAAHVDGADTVGHGQPFGVFVDLVHTKEIERESGGFGKYLQNQNQQYFSYNYGRPTENYRDKFKDGVTAALQDQFEVISVTFNDPETTSKSLPEYGWRVTPYAYLLLKAKGPEVDRLPPLKIDLDFLDTSGYVILPVESAALPLDASSAEPLEREVGKLDIVQTLDERQAREGKLVLEVKATARGLVPELDKLIEKKSPGFEIAAIDDQGLSVTQFDKEADEPRIIAERLWTITYQAPEGQEKPPTVFAFPESKIADATLTRQRYDDADMVAADAIVPLTARYGSTSYAWAWIAGIAVVVLGLVAWLISKAARRPAKASARKFTMPSQVTPFTVLGLLENIQQNNGLNEAGHRELAATIDGLQKHYFVEPQGADPDLQGIARNWVQRCE